MEKMKMGISDSGGIADTMANKVRQMADGELYADCPKGMEMSHGVI